MSGQLSQERSVLKLLAWGVTGESGESYYRDKNRSQCLRLSEGAIHKAQR